MDTPHIVLTYVQYIHTTYTTVDMTVSFRTYVGIYICMIQYVCMYRIRTLIALILQRNISKEISKEIHGQWNL